MPSFSERSHAALSTCHPELRRLFYEVIRHWDCTVLEGVRSEEQQAENVRRGVSKTLASKHLKQPDGWAHAVDVAPFPVDWQDTERFRAFGGFVLGVAAIMGVPLIWGGDWNGNRTFKDERFVDLPHFELRAS